MREAGCCELTELTRKTTPRFANPGLVPCTYAAQVNDPEQAGGATVGQLVDPEVHDAETKLKVPG
jgi:hypothetical protein